MNEIEFILSDLNRGRYRSDQIEKNVEKWMKKVFKHLYEYSSSGQVLIQLTKKILEKVKENNLNRVIGPNVGLWVTELLQKAVKVKNSTVYLSIIALFLSFMPISCKMVKRKSWLNLIKLIDGKSILRKQSAIILASASKKEILSDLISELVLQMHQVSPVLIPSSIELPAPRSIDSITDSFLVIPKDSKTENKIDFISKFISTHILTYGTSELDVENFVALVKCSSSMPDVFSKLGEIFSDLLNFYTPELMPISKYISLTLCDLCENQNQKVRSKARSLLITWFDRTRSYNAIILHPNFEAFILDQLKKIQNDSESFEIYKLLNAIVRSFGEFLNLSILNQICYLIVKRLPGLMDTPDVNSKMGLLELAETIICCKRANTPINQIHQILRNFVRSEFTDFETLQIVTRLFNFCDRLVTPFHTPKTIQFVQIEHEGDSMDSRIDSRPEPENERKSYAGHVTAVPVNIAEQLNRIETELTLFRKRSDYRKNKRTKREKKHNPGSQNGALHSDGGHNNELQEGSSGVKGLNNGVQGNVGMQEKDVGEYSEGLETESESESSETEPVAKKRRDDVSVEVMTSEGITSEGMASTEMTSPSKSHMMSPSGMTSSSPYKNEKNDEGNETLENLMSLFSEEPA